MLNIFIKSLISGFILFAIFIIISIIIGNKILIGKMITITLIYVAVVFIIFLLSQYVFKSSSKDKEDKQN